MATLPFDIARCFGATDTACQDCRRREPGREDWQAYIAPLAQDGECVMRIAPSLAQGAQEAPVNG